MNKLKVGIIAEAIIILVLLALMIKIFYNPFNPDNNYCEKNYDNANKCLLSPRVYTNIILPKSYLIFNLGPLKKEIEDYLNESNLNVSVYMANLRDGASFEIQSNKAYPAASLNKLPLAILILRKVESSNLSLNTNLSILDEDRDMSSGSLYFKDISQLSVKELLYYMLSESDNTATNVLGRQATKEELTKLSDYIDFYSNDIRKEEQPLKTTEITTKKVSNIFSSLYLSTVLEPKDSELILSYLKNTSFDIKKYANLPDEVAVVQKEGFHYLDDGSFFHSCGIIYVKDSRFSFCIMTEGIDRNKAPFVIGEIVNKTYNFIVKGRNMTKSGI